MRAAINVPAPLLQADQVAGSLHACQLAKRGNALRVHSKPCAGPGAALAST